MNVLHDVIIELVLAILLSYYTVTTLICTPMRHLVNTVVLFCMSVLRQVEKAQYHIDIVGTHVQRSYRSIAEMTR